MWYCYDLRYETIKYHVHVTVNSLFHALPLSAFPHANSLKMGKLVFDDCGRKQTNFTRRTKHACGADTLFLPPYPCDLP